MKLKTVAGREVYKNVDKYRINWDTKSRSKYQKQVKDFLKKYWQKHIVFEEFPVFGSRMTVDFFNATKRLVIEVQGEFHTGFSEFAHGTEFGYMKQIKRDRKKADWCESNELTLLELFPEDLPLTPELFKSLGIPL